MCKIIAIANQKGGVGKTTTTSNLGIGLAKQGKRVLLIDADAQGSLTASLGFKEPDKLEITLANVLANIINDEEMDTDYGILKHEEGIDLMPGNIELSGLEVSLVNVMSREVVLRSYVEMVKDRYDYILIDCMPSLGMITINAFACADSILIPVQAAYLPVKGLEQLIKTIGKVKRQINPKLEIEGILLTMVDSRTNYARVLRQYNWGYDPTNFNVPEGSYSTDPTRGEVRIRECREMIAALHAAGIGVVMDVVYNHTYRTENPLNNTVPYYFFRQNPDGSFSNGSGCGNEFASERPMARRYLIDSILYWAKEYHIDGFRFDLMGLYDAESINAVRAALDSLPGGRDILLYGEPWQGGASQLHRYEANKANLAILNERVGIFCDDTRDAIKGGCFDAREPGYVEGKPGSFWDIGAAVAAWCRSDRLPPHAPSQIVSYVSAHDNFTLWDKLLCVRYEKPEFTARDTVALAQNRLAAGIYLTSFGLPFMQAGEEFARTKKGVGNSYRSSPALNRLDWNRAEQYHALVDYYRGLLALRAAFPRLGSTDRRAPEALQFFALEQPLVGWTLPAVWGDGAAWSALCVFYNPTDTTRTVSLPAGQWKLLSDGTSSSLWRGQSRIFTGNAPLAPYSATVFGAV